MPNNWQRENEDGTLTKVTDRGDGTARREVWESPLEEVKISDDIILQESFEDEPPSDLGLPAPALPAPDARALLVRAEEAREAARSDFLAGKTRTMALLDAANKVGSDAFLAVLASE